jgi:phosphoglycolate phosphatase
VNGHLPSPAAILFDWDGTLVDNWAAIVAGINQALEAFGMPVWSLEEAMDRISASQRDSFPILFGPDWERARDIFYAGFEENHLGLLKVLDGAVELLDAAAAVPLAVVSNKNGGYLRKEAEHLGWRRRFGALIGATDAVADKPDPAPVSMALQPLGLVAGPQIWFVGDSATDMATARACGCTAILVRHHSSNLAPVPEALKPDLMIPSLPALIETLVENR